MGLGTARFYSFAGRLVACLLLAALLLPVSGAHAQDDTFVVTVGTKTDDHPNNPDQGFPAAYYIDGQEALVLTLERGTTYTFQMQNVPSNHPFYISTSDVGAGTGEYTEGVTGSMATGNETLTFTPSESTPDQLYYQCGFHQYMGWQINVVDAAPTETYVATLSGGQAVPANASTDTSGELKERFGTLAFLVTGLQEAAAFEPLSLELELTGEAGTESWSGEAIAVLVGNARKFVEEGGQADMEDGLFDVAVVEQMPAGNLVTEAITHRILGEGTEHVQHFPASEVEVACESICSGGGSRTVRYWPNGRPARRERHWPARSRTSIGSRAPPSEDLSVGSSRGASAGA